MNTPVRLLAVCSLVLGVGAPPAHADAPWLAPVPLAEEGTDFPGDTSVAMTPGGTAVVAFDRVDGARRRAVAATRAPGEPFGAPVTLSTGSTAVRQSSVKVATDRQGDLTAAWTQVDPVTPSQSFVAVARRPSGGTWTSPQTVSTGDAKIESVAVAAGDGGRAVVTWAQKGAAGERVWMTRIGAGGTGFDAATAVSEAGAPSDVIYSTTAAAMTPGGDAVLAWQRFHDYGAGQKFVDEVAPLPAGAAPGTVIQITSVTAGGAGSPPSLAIAPSGRALIGGDYYDGTTSQTVLQEYVPGSTFAGGSLQALPSPSTGGSATTVKVAIADGGAATVAWADGQTVTASTRVGPAAAFGAPQRLSGLASANSLALAEGAAGDAQIAWPVNGGDALTLYASRRRPGEAAFAAPVTVATAPVPSGGSGSFSALAAAADDQGNAFLAATRRITTAAAVSLYTPQVVGHDGAAPELSVTGPAGGTAGAALPFAATVTDRMSAPTVAWDFGDAGTATGAAPAHAFAAAGTYTVKAAATDAVGNRADASRTVAVSAPPAGSGGGGTTRPPAVTPAVVGARVALKAKRRGKVTRVKRLVVSGLRRGDVVKLRCSGKGCTKRARRTVTQKRGSRLTLTASVKRLRLRKGARLTVTVTRTGSVARIITYTFGARRPARVVRCQDPGARRPRTC